MSGATSRWALCNARILLEDWVTDQALIIAGERIEGLVARDDRALRQLPTVDLDGRALVPGFIDCQVNGGGGVLFNDAPVLPTLQRIGAAHRKFGTTAFLPTLITDEVAVMRAALDAVRAALAVQTPGVIGIHLEGPFLAPERKGVHDAAKFKEPDAALLDLVTSLPGRTVLTVAPERVPPAVIAQLVARGVIVSLGHTAASYSLARAALDAGATGVTHLFNAMSPLQSREPGVVGAALDDPGCWCGLIVDGEHAHPAAMRIAVRAKRRGRTLLVTDAMPPVGSDDPGFTLNGERIDCRDGVLRNPAGALAGSVLDMASAVRNCVRLLGLPLAEAARMASTYPAEFLRQQDSIGRIAPGLRADLVALNDDLTVHRTWLGGVA